MTTHKNDSTQYPSPSKKNKETVRTTFNVSAETHASMLSLCENFNLKQKQLIDEIIVPTVQIFFKNLDSEKLKNLTNHGELQRRTFTLSRSSLSALNSLSDDKGVQRDILFQVGISLQKSMLEDMLKKHREAAKLVEELSTKCAATESALSYLDDDDPIKHRVSVIGVIIDSLLMEINDELKDGTPINYDF